MSEHDEHTHGDHHEMPTRGRALDAVALSATLHCLTGCAIGEVTGMIIGTALGFSDLGTIALAVALAFLFGYTLTSFPLLRAGLALGAVIPIALASDTFSIAVMEIVDNAIMLIVPGAMESGVGDILFWGALSFALVVAGVFAFPVNRWLIRRGKGHTAVHNTGIHGGPPVRLVGAAVVVMAVFGTAVLVAEAVDDEGAGHGGHEESAQEGSMPTAQHSEGTEDHGGGSAADPVRGLTASEAGMTLRLERDQLARGQRTELAFTIESADGAAVRDFEVEHEKRLHLIVVRRDMQGFQHLHPRMTDDGRWSTPITIDEGGPYRVFADFKRDGRNHTLADDIEVPGEYNEQPYPVERDTALTDSGYEVTLESGGLAAGEEAELEFTVARNGEHVAVEPYLGADGHLVALREGDLAYLHVHPSEGGHGGGGHAAGEGGIRFETEFPTTARYALFLQFKHGGRVHTAHFGADMS
jgi:hypothetical protein